MQIIVVIAEFRQDIQTLDEEASEDHRAAAESGFGGGASDME